MGLGFERSGSGCFGLSEFRVSSRIIGVPKVDLCYPSMGKGDLLRMQVPTPSKDFRFLGLRDPRIARFRAFAPSRKP